MNKKEVDFYRAFGSAPGSFKDRVADTLCELQEEKPMKRASFRTILIMALVGVLLIGAAYAAVTRLGLVDYFSGHRNVELSEDAQKMMSFDEPLYTTTLGDFAVEITSAVADGRCWYASAVLTPTVDDAVMVGMWGTPQSLIGEQAGTARRFIAELSCGTPYDVMQSFDYVLPHMDEGMRLPEGGMLLYTDGAMETVEGDSARLDCYVRLWEVDAAGMQMDATETIEFFKLDLPFSAPIETRRASDMPVTIEGMDATIESIELVLTPLTTYYRIDFSITEEAANRNGAPFFTPLVNITDEAGGQLPHGSFGWGNTGSEDDLHYVATGTLDLHALPEAIHVQGVDKERIYEVIAIPLDIVG